MPPLAGNGRRRQDSFNVAHDYRPSTWPEYEYPYVLQEHLHLPAPKLPTFVPATPRKSSTPSPTSTSHKRPTAPTPPPPSSSQKYASPPPVSSVPRRRLDKVTPSSYTFASDSTKLGEIPQRNWTTPWDYEEAERLNHEAAAAGMPVVSKEEVKVDGKKKGLFRWMRRGEGAGA